MQPIFRFAPSPNGRLHLGHAYSALLNESLAQKLHGRFLLRIEDIDPNRCTEAFTQGVFEDLRWLGLQWEEPVRVQSRHLQDYAHAAEQLKARGLLYPCFCSRSQIAALGGAFDPDGAPLYSGTCQSLTTPEVNPRIAGGEPHSWRLNMQEALKHVPRSLSYTRFSLPSFAEESINANPAEWGDVILQRKETPTSYHLSVVVDDALQEVTHIVRGRDLEASTSIHVLLQRLLNLPTPLYHHHPLLASEGGEKLSKSKGTMPLADLRGRGISAEAIRRELHLGQLTQPLSSYGALSVSTD